MLRGPLSQRDDSCSNNYTSKNGLRFDSICGKNIPCATNSINCDLDNYRNITSLTDCEEKCAQSRYKCYGVAYDATGGRCWLKGSNISPSMQVLVREAVVHSALVNKTQLTPLDLSCPYGNGSTVVSQDGAAFQMLCSLDFPKIGDYIPYSYPGRYHTDTLDQCLDYCAAAHPMCNVVAWNVGLEIGYSNCYLKTGIPDNAVPIDPGAANGAHTHSARLLASNKQRINSSIPQNSAYTSNDVSFTIQQTTGRSGASNYTSLHANNITACMDSCSQNSTCQGCLLDLSMDDGYKNCYLLNNTGSPSNGSFSMTYAQKVGVTQPTVSESKAWIAGAVIGPIGFIAIIGLVFFLWRRQQRKQSYTPVKAISPAWHAVEERLPDTEIQTYEKPDFEPHELPAQSHQQELAADGSPQELPAHGSGRIP